MPTNNVRNNFCLVLLSHNWRGDTKVVFKLKDVTRGVADGELKRLRDFSDAEYVIVGPRQLKSLLAKQAMKQKANRAEGAKKAARTRLRCGPNFIRCRCGAKSKKLFSEMGGLQTRRCQNGHLFEFDTFGGLNMFSKYV